MIIKRIKVGSLETNCYVVINEKNEAIVIDPGDERKKILEFLKPYKIVEILVTHHHFDHIGALSFLEEFYSLKENVHYSDFDYEVILTPGHTSDSISFYFPKLNAVFTGDFIFKQSIGRMDIGGNELEMKKSLQMFFQRFTSDVQIYPGHGDATSLKEEKDYLRVIEKHLC